MIALHSYWWNRSGQRVRVINTNLQGPLPVLVMDDRGQCFRVDVDGKSPEVERSLMMTVCDS